jgi:predicted nuclease of predicted toxin-antitoxin system
MKFKLDENFGTRTQQLFRDAGHQVQTVREQGLSGASDQDLYEVCRTEQFCMVTFDLDFSDVLRFPPQRTNGIVVIRVPKNPSVALLERLIRQFLQALTQMSVEKRLWIVEVGRIRIHQQEESE